jgi:predicted transcriptional regulator
MVGRMKSPKAMTIRLTPDQADELEAVADVDDSAISDVIRAAIREHIAKRRRDPKFQERLRSRIDRVSKLLDD